MCRKKTHLRKIQVKKSHWCDNQQFCVAFPTFKEVYLTSHAVQWCIQFTECAQATEVKMQSTTQLLHSRTQLGKTVTRTWSCKLPVNPTNLWNNSYKSLLFKNMNIRNVTFHCSLPFPPPKTETASRKRAEIQRSLMSGLRGRHFSLCVAVICRTHRQTSAL